MLLTSLLILTAVAEICAIDPADAAAQMTLSYEAFDDLEAAAGWRSLNAAGCADTATGLLQSYLSANAARLTEEQRAEIAFHMGQSFAFAGRDAEAVPHFERSLTPGATSEWRTYVQASLAFLRRDSAALLKARDAYAKIAPGSMRLQILDGMIACPKETYMRAVHCRM